MALKNHALFHQAKSLQINQQGQNAADYLASLILGESEHKNLKLPRRFVPQSANIN